MLLGVLDLQVRWRFHRVNSNSCETWVLKENTKLKLQVFERKVLRRIYGPTKENDGTWRIKSNEELNRLIGNKNVIKHINLLAPEFGI